MNIIFIHRNYPAQFKYLISVLSKEEGNNIVFITNNTATAPIPKVQKIVYALKRQIPDDCHRYLRFYEESIIHGQGAAEKLLLLKEQGFKPDLIIGHSWGSSMFAKEVFPDTPYIAYIEWYYNYTNSDVDFIDKDININEKARLICKNSHILQDLVRCDYAISPTNWQKQQSPEIFHNKIKVIHEGIDTDYCKPDENVEFKIPNTNITLTKKNKVLTYATRGMEEYRGFPEFMHAASILMKKMPDLHVLVGGEDRVCYGRKILNSTFKKEMLKKYDFDMNRIHFTGGLPYTEYVKLLQVSTAHIYLTYPFVLSWSFLEAMSTGCSIVASNTPPVVEYMKNKHNGILVDFSDIDAIVNNTEDILKHPKKYKTISENARKTIIDKCELKDMLKKQIDFIKDCIKKS